MQFTMNLSYFSFITRHSFLCMRKLLAFETFFGIYGGLWRFYASKTILEPKLLFGSGELAIRVLDDHECT